MHLWHANQQVACPEVSNFVHNSNVSGDDSGFLFMLSAQFLHCSSPFTCLPPNLCNFYLCVEKKLYGRSLRSVTAFKSLDLVK